ncbi:hypothetical protein [Mycolicibacterium sp.]|uniref:hypothetical protein n=1 Tax=Mycolicibacterium sp. TaxID=2320850 RepID=UPI0025E43F70|nr:hypothetical protein [Mycolicibacterium sp.]MCB9408089.1 hypothetical protein [Mycolicibacterium sp.]MCB9424195.1 hypothetical protein [Actinomycetota bacterium]
MTARCEVCAAVLNRHNVTGLCAECKLVARNARLSGKPADSQEPMILADAIALVMAELTATVIHTTERNQ